MQSRTQNFFRNTLMTAFYQFVVMLSGFILPKVMLSCYGSEMNGLVTSITQFINYITLVEAGLSGAAVYALYKPLADKDTKEISRIVVATKKFYNISGWIFVGLVALLAVVYPLIAQTQSLGHLDVSVLVLVIGVSGTLDFFVLAKYRAILTADQKQYVISRASLTYCVLNTFLVALFSIRGYGIIVARVIALLAVFTRSIMLSSYCKKHYSYLDYSAEPNKEALNKRWDALFLQILGTVHVGVPVVLSTLLTSLSSVSIYSVYNMVINGVNSILSIFCSGLGAGFGDLIARKENDRLQRAYSDFEFAYYALITFIYSIAMVQILPFVLIYTEGITDANYNQPILGILFALNGFLFNVKTPQGMMVTSAGLYKETKKQTATQAAIAIIGGLLLGRAYGLMGILIAMCLSNLYRDIDLICFIPRNVTHLKIRATVKNLMVSIIEMAIIVVVGMMIPWNNASFGDWVFSSILLALYSFGVILVISFLTNKKQMFSVITRVKSVFHK